MENINKTYKTIGKNDTKLSFILHSDLSINKSNELFNNNSRLINNYNNYIKKKDFIISKNKLITNKDLINYHPSRLLKNGILKIFTKNNKVDASTQKNFFIKKVNKIKSNNILKNLIENIPKKKSKAVDYVLESPHRGVEKIQYSSSVNNNKIKEKKSLFSPIYVNKTYKGYFYKNNNCNLSTNFISEINNSFFRKNYRKKLFIDKYQEIKRNKELDNPLERLSKISGISCYKLRQVIDYSLTHKIKDLLSEEKENKKYNNKENNIYSFITLKSKKNRGIIEEFSNDLENNSFENKIYAKKIKEMKSKSDIKDV